MQLDTPLAASPPHERRCSYPLEGAATRRGRRPPCISGIPCLPVARGSDLSGERRELGPPLLLLAQRDARRARVSPPAWSPGRESLPVRHSRQRRGAASRPIEVPPGSTVGRVSAPLGYGDQAL